VSGYVRWIKELLARREKSEVFNSYSPSSSFKSKLKFGEIWKEFGKKSKMSLISASYLKPIGNGGQFKLSDLVFSLVRLSGQVVRSGCQVRWSGKVRSSGCKVRSSGQVRLSGLVSLSGQVIRTGQVKSSDHVRLGHVRLDCQVRSSGQVMERWGWLPCGRGAGRNSRWKLAERGRSGETCERES
jgi:hypothetical protein